MGEFYAQRKLFNRTKRTTKTQEDNFASLPSSCSVTCVKLVAKESSQAEQADPKPENGAGETPAAAPPHLSTSLKSMPQLSATPIMMMIRQSSNETSSSSAGDICDSALGSIGTNVYETSADIKTQRHQVSGAGPRQARSKFISASRAISLLRRAASSLTGSGSAGLSSHHHLTGASGRDGSISAAAQTGFARQNTADSVQSQASLSSFRPPSSAGSSSKEMPPQFIVPKMGALRLPLVCRIKSLDGELMREVFVHRYELGQYLLESLKVSVGINDCKYYGFKLAKSYDDQEDLRNPWLDLNESVCKQLKSIKLSSGTSASQSFSLPTSVSSTGNCNGNGFNQTISAQLQQASSNNLRTQRSIDFYLRIKFYPPNLARVQDAFLRHYLWLQLRRDLRLGKLTSSMNNLTLLMACVLQYELGDCKPDLVERVPELNILQNQDLIEEQAIEIWQTRLSGLKRHQAQMQFLRAAVILETYGFDYYPVRDHQRQRAYLLGFNYAGVKTIRNGRIVHHFRWHNISKISYERRMIIFHIYPNENSKRKQILGFKCLSNEDCQNLYLRLVEQKYFFTVDLAYFDKSVRRPSCLYNSPSLNQLHWTADGGAATTDEPAASGFGRADHVGASGQANHLAEHEEPNTSSNERSDTSSVSHQAQPACSICLQQQQQQRQDTGPHSMRTDSPAGAVGNNTAQHSSVSPQNQAGFARDTSTSVQSNSESAYLSTWLRGSASGEPCEQATLQRPRLWAQITSCAATKPQLVWRRLTSFVEWATAAFFQSHREDFAISQTSSSESVSGERRQLAQQCDHHQIRAMLASAFRLCLIVVLMNLLLRVADNCSSTLIELFTINPSVAPASSSNGIGRPL